MTPPEQNRNPRPDERARAYDRDRDGRGRDERGPDGRERAAGRERIERARDDRERQRYGGQNGGRHGGRDEDEDLDMDADPETDADTDAERERERGGQGQERVRGQGRRSGEPSGGSGGSGGGFGEGSGSGGRARGPLIGEYAPPYRRRSGRVAAVLLYRNGGHRVIWPDRTEDVNKPMFGSAYTVFEVQLGRNVTEFRLRLPAAGDGVFFEAVAKVQWVVTDPHLVVQEQVEDVAEFLHDELLDGLRRLSRRFRITEAQRADEAVREELSAGRLGFGRDIGLRTRVLVFIDLDDSVKAEVSRRDRVGVTMEADERVAEAERRREAADRALVADRAREMEALFRRGDLAQIAHHMAMHPDKQWEIRTQLQRERREGQADYLAVFNRLLDTGVLERHDIGEQMYQVLMYLRTQTGTVLGGITDRVLNPPGDSTRRRLDPGTALPEPSLPDWDEEHGDAPRDPRVYEPTRVESGSERDRDRDRDHGRDRYEPDDPFERTDYEGNERSERYDRYDRDDPYDRDGRGDSDRGGDSDRRGDRSRGPARPRRHSSGFDDWDDS
ncbi:hypothetical protein [Streptomyces sp. P9-A4]|uniref:hypothetical protein n=1 Tax=Streptomyces sp. P9-A4 TaxID=3072285 RepID=UPI002FC8634E